MFTQMQTFTIHLCDMPNASQGPYTSVILGDMSVYQYKGGSPPSPSAYTSLPTVIQFGFRCVIGKR